MTRAQHQSTVIEMAPVEQGGAGQGATTGHPRGPVPNSDPGLLQNRIGVSCYSEAGSLPTVRAPHEDGTDRTRITGRTDMAAHAPDRRSGLAAVDHMGGRSGTLLMAAGQGPGSGLRAAHGCQSPRCHPSLPAACSGNRPALTGGLSCHRPLRAIAGRHEASAPHLTMLPSHRCPGHTQRFPQFAKRRPWHSKVQSRCSGGLRFWGEPRHYFSHQANLDEFWRMLVRESSNLEIIVVCLPITPINSMIVGQHTINCQQGDQLQQLIFCQQPIILAINTRVVTYVPERLGSRLPQGNRSWIRRRRIARCAGRVLQLLFNQGGFIFEVQLGIIVVWAVFTDGHIQFLLFVCKTNVEEGRTTCKCGASCHISPQAFAAGQIHAGGRP